MRVIIERFKNENKKHPSPYLVRVLCDNVIVILFMVWFSDVQSILIHFLSLGNIIVHYVAINNNWAHFIFKYCRRNFLFLILLDAIGSRSRQGIFPGVFSLQRLFCQAKKMQVAHLKVKVLVSITRYHTLGKFCIAYWDLTSLLKCFSRF